MPFTTLFFDLDDTLYPNTNGLWGAIRERMNDYMCERMGLPREEVARLRASYYEAYGTTLRGLQRHHQVEARDFLAFVHDLPLENYLQPDPELRALLASLRQQKWIFTNADLNHAGRVLRFLGLEGCFDGLVDIAALGYVCMPESEAYRKAMALARATSPQACLLFDDSPRNLAPARELGFTTVLVGRSEPHPAAHHTIPSLKALPQVMPELW